jgi:hypothetical protein
MGLGSGIRDPGVKKAPDPGSRIRNTVVDMSLDTFMSTQEKFEKAECGSGAGSGSSSKS